MQVKFYKVLSVHVLLYSSETRIMRRKDESSRESIKIKYFLSDKWCVKYEQSPNREIREELQINSLYEEMNTYKQNRVQYLDRMGTM